MHEVVGYFKLSLRTLQPSEEGGTLLLLADPDLVEKQETTTLLSGSVKEAIVLKMRF